MDIQLTPNQSKPDFLNQPEIAQEVETLILKSTNPSTERFKHFNAILGGLEAEIVALLEADGMQKLCMGFFKSLDSLGHNGLERFAIKTNFTALDPATTGMFIAIFYTKLFELAESSMIPGLREFLTRAGEFSKILAEAKDFHKESCEKYEVNQKRGNESRLVIQQCQRRLAKIESEEQQAANSSTEISSDIRRRNKDKESLYATLAKHEFTVNKCENREAELSQNVLIAGDLRTEARDRYVAAIENFQKKYLETFVQQIDLITCSENEVFALRSKVESDVREKINPDPEKQQELISESATTDIKRWIRIAREFLRKRESTWLKYRAWYLNGLSMQEFRAMTLELLRGESTPGVVKFCQRMTHANGQEECLNYNFKTPQRLGIEEKFPSASDQEIFDLERARRKKCSELADQLLTKGRFGKDKLTSKELAVLTIFIAREAVYYKLHFE